MNPVDEYLRLANAWGASMAKGDATTANQLHDRVQLIFQAILQAKQESALFEQAETAGDLASFFIASHLKHRDQARALALYERLARSPHPFIAISSKYIIKEMTRSES